MAGERVDGKVALRLFLLLVGVLFIWNSIPSHRWTKNVSNNIETGMWSTCSCVGVGFKDCNLEYTELEKQYFLVKANLTDKKQDPTKYKAQQDAYAQGQLLFPSGHQHQGANPSSKQPSVTARKNNNNNGKNNNTNNNNNNNNKHNNNNNSDKNINKDSKQCTQYNGSGAIALISYIFAFIALLVIVKNIAGNVLPVLNGSVFGFVILSGIFGLIATCMFGDLYGSRLVPFGYHFGLFTTAWVLFLVVGLSGMSDLRKGGAASESTSAVRAGLLVLALTAFAFSMGNNWYVHNETLLAPLGGRNWTIKAGTFFIEPTNTLGFDSATSLDSIKDLVKPKDQKKPFWCDAEFQDYGKDTVAPATQSQSVAHDVGRKKNNNNDKGNSNKGNKNEHKHHSKDHSKDGCMTNPEVTEVKGFKEIGLYAGCYCKDTLSTQCSLFGSYEIMFDNRSYNCTIFQVSRAMVLMVGILALASMVLSSALLGGLRKVELHLLSNTLAFLAAVLGLISTILFGVLYSVDDLAQDFAIYLAGWWLVFFAAVLGGPVAGYYREVQSAGQVSPVPVELQ